MLNVKAGSHTTTSTEHVWTAAGRSGCGGTIMVQTSPFCIGDAAGLTCCLLPQLHAQQKGPGKRTVEFLGEAVWWPCASSLLWMLTPISRRSWQVLLPLCCANTDPGSSALRGWNMTRATCPPPAEPSKGPPGTHGQRGDCHTEPQAQPQQHTQLLWANKVQLLRPEIKPKC